MEIFAFFFVPRAALERAAAAARDAPADVDAGAAVVAAGCEGFATVGVVAGWEAVAVSGAAFCAGAG